MMMRITALNEELEEEDSEAEGEGGVTREALEEIAMQQYARCLELQKKGNLTDARKLLRDLLDTELLGAVLPSETPAGVPQPLLNLKYLCYRNIASISAQLGDSEAAVDAYLEASTYDPSDITLWYRLGTTSLKLEKFDLALYAFQRGVSCNAKHWPCLDSLITLSLGLGEYNDCIFAIYRALDLDPDYLRGRTYRKLIFTEFPYVQDFVASLNPLYKWTPDMDKDIHGEDCVKMLSEANQINEAYTKQVFDNKVVERLPILTLNKSIENWSWISLGESLVDMHMHITENLLSHACVIKVSQPEMKPAGDSSNEEPMEVDCDDPKIKDIENNQTVEKVVSEKIQDEKLDKTGNESDKMDTEAEAPQHDPNKFNIEVKEAKKVATRRRGSSLSFLQQWEWCTKRRSSRKKPTNRQDQNETIYDTLKRLLPSHLVPDENRQEKVKDFKTDDSLDTMDLYKLFEEKEKGADKTQDEIKTDVEISYFHSEKEQSDVQEFIQKYVDSTCDIITMLDDFVETLSKFWERLWPDGLGDIFMEANWCARQHFEPPLGYDKSAEVLTRFININLIHLETGINKLLEDEDEKKGNVETELIDLLKLLCSRKDSLGENALNLTIRFLWVKCHSLLYKEEVEFALDCLYYIIYELNCLDEEGASFSLKVPNFTKWPLITKSNCIELIKSLERNKKLSTVPSLYNTGKYEEAIEILQDSFKYCQHQASKQEWGNMALDWAVQLVILLESHWALGDTEQCFTWAAVCLHESLKQYMLCEQGCDNYTKWSLTVVKALMSFQHILIQEGSGYLDKLTTKAMTRLVQDIIQVVVHQLDDSNTSQDMQLNTIAPWILLHYIFQREEDCGRMKKKISSDEIQDSDIPASLLILFTAHDNLGKKGWCTIHDGELLRFTLKNVIPRLRSPALFSVAESVSQYLEQCVFCLFGYPSKKTKLRYLIDHLATPIKLDWEWSQQIFNLFRPEEMPEFNTYRLGAITAESEQLFQNILVLAPPGIDPHPYCGDVIAFIEGRKSKLPDVNIELPYKLRDIYYLLADFYLKNTETIKALKYYSYDIVICKNRFDSWAGMALGRGSLLEAKLNSCEIFRSEKEYLTKATAVEACFKKALEIDSSQSMLWIEYGAFVYGVHSFCSRTLKQASESLSMDSFEVLENRKEAMLDTAHRCFINAHRQWMAECQTDDKGPQDERWLHYYMLGKIAEKKNEAPQKYLEYYQKASKSLLENNATYPTKINYNNPQNLSVEALEIHYRIHASILKYIEQHENKVIYAADGKSFMDCLDQCAMGPFSTKKKIVKDSIAEKDSNNESNDIVEKGNTEINKDNPTAVKRSNSDGGVQSSEESSSKKIKLSQSGKDITNNEDVDSGKKVESVISTDQNKESENKPETVETPIIKSPPEIIQSDKDKDSDIIMKTDNDEKEVLTEDKKSLVEIVESPKNGESDNSSASKNVEQIQSSENVTDNVKKSDEQAKDGDTEVKKVEESNASNTATSKENTSSDSSSDTSSEDSSSDSSSDSSDDSENSKAAPTEMTQEQIGEIISICLENLEDCVSRFPQHYKALYRLAHFHFYYKRDKNVNKCRDLMLGSFTIKNGAKLQGLFCERKNSNFFNGIWRIPASEVDRPGSFASHMSRCVLITMEVLKEKDDFKTLLDLSLQLQRTPDAEKKYLRDSERIELSQQALSLCTRSIKGQLGKFGKQSNVHKDGMKRKDLSNLMLDLYKAFQKVQKHNPPKTSMFSALLIDSYKLYSGKSDADNLLEKSIKKCQAIILNMKHQAQAALVSTVNVAPVESVAPPATVPPPALPPPVVAPPPPPIKKPKPAIPVIIPATNFLPHVDPPIHSNIYNQFSPPPFMPMMDNVLMSAALSQMEPAVAAMYMRELTGVHGYQSDFLRKMIGIDPSYLNKSYSQSSKPKTPTTKPNMMKSSQQNKMSPASNIKQQSQMKVTSPSNLKSFSNYTSAQLQSVSKSSPQMPSKSSPSPTTPTSPFPVSSPQNLYGAQLAHSTSASPGPSTGNSSAQPAHQIATSTASTSLHSKPPAPHQQVSPGKTLQEKLAERQKQNPSVSKPSSDVNTRITASSAFPGKIPSSLTITKASVKANEEQKQYKDVPKAVRDPKKPSQFGPMEKLAQPTKLIDSNEVIVLDDD